MIFKSRSVDGSSVRWLIFLLLGTIVFFVYRWTALKAFDVRVDNVLASPSSSFLLGTDNLGRDYLARVLRATVNSCFIVACALGLTLILGTIYGFFAATLPRRLQTPARLFLDIFASIPVFALMIIFAVFLHEHIQYSAMSSYVVVVVALSVGSWPMVARTVRGEYLRLAQEPFVDASRALGATRWQSFRVQIWPHLRESVFTVTIAQLPSKLMMENTLGVIGLSLPDPEPSLGKLLGESWGQLSTHPWLMLAPAIVIAAMGLLFFSIADRRRAVR